MFNTPPRGPRPPRPRRAPPVVAADSFDNASGIFSTSGTISECTMASFLLESNDRPNNRTSGMESPRQQHDMSPNTAALLRRKQEDARDAILSLNRFIFQAGNLYRGKRLNRDEENILRESANEVGISGDIVDALLEHTSDSNAVVQYCMESEDSFAKKIRKDRRLSQLLQQDVSEPEGSFNLKSSIWRILMYKIVQQTLRDHGMDIGDVMDKSYSGPQMHAKAAYNDEYAMNSAASAQYGRDYTEERKRLMLPEDEIRNARHRAIAQMEFHQSRAPLDSLQNRDDMEHPSQRSSPLTPRSPNVPPSENNLHRTPPSGSTPNRIDPDENDYHHMENENHRPHSSGISPQAPLSAVKRALAMFESPGNFDQEPPQKPNNSSTKVRRGSSSKIADRLALFEKGVQENNDPTDYQKLERVRSSEHQAIQATSLFDIFSTPQKQTNGEHEDQRVASTSKISKMKRSQIAAFENRGFERNPEANIRLVRSEVKKLDPSRRILFDEPSQSFPSIEDHADSGSVDSHLHELYHSGSQQVSHPQHMSDSYEEPIDDYSGPSESIDELKHGWKNHSTPPTSSRRFRNPSRQSIVRDGSKKHVTFGESPREKKPDPQERSFSNPQKTAMDKMLKKARAPPKPPTPSKQSQRSRKIREQLLKNMSMTSTEQQREVVSNEEIPSDNISISSHHSMEESLDPASVQDYGPRREVKRTPRPKRNIREENFMDDERVRVEPPEDMFYFESIDEITKNMMEEDSLMEQAMNANAHHANVLVSETLSSSPGNSAEEHDFQDQRMEPTDHFPGDHEDYETFSVPDQFSDLPVDEDDMSEEQPFVSDIAKASNAVPTDSMLSSLTPGELIQAPGSQSTFTDDGSRSWVEFHQVFDSIHGARSEISRVESDLNSSRKSMENMFDTLHEVKQQAISMERRKPEREAVETAKPTEAYHPVTPRAPKVNDNDFFEDVRLSGSKATFQVSHNGSDNSEYAANEVSMSHSREQRQDNNSSTQLLNGTQTDPEEWAYFQNSHFHSDASYEDASGLGREEAVEHHVSDVTDSRDMTEDTTEPFEQVAYRDNGMNMAASTITASNDESDVDFNPYGSKIAQPKGLRLSNVPEKAMKMARGDAGMNDLPSQSVNEDKPKTPRQSLLAKARERAQKHSKSDNYEEEEQQKHAQPQSSSPRYPRSPAFKKALQKMKKNTAAEVETQQQKHQKSSPRYPRSPTFVKAMQKAKQHSANKDTHENSKHDPQTARGQQKAQISSPKYPRSPADAYNKAKQERKEKASDHETIPPIREKVSSLSVEEEIARALEPPPTQFDYQDLKDLPPPPSLEEAFKTVDTDNLQDDAFHQAKTPRTSHGRARQTSNRINSIQMKRSSSSLSRMLRVDTSRSDEEDVGLNGVPVVGQSLKQAAQASGVPQQVLDIILKQAAKHEQELVEAASEEDLRSWDAAAKKTRSKKKQAESPLATAKTEAFYSLPKQKKTKPVKLDISLIPDEIPEGVSKEDVKLLERFIQLSTSQFEGKHLSSDSEARVRAAANNVGLAEDVIDQLLEQARWKREQKAKPEDDSLHQPQPEPETTNNNTYHQYHADYSTTQVRFEDVNHATGRHQFPSASPVKPRTTAYPESPGYTYPKGDQRWATHRRRSESYRRSNRKNACDDPCRILGNIKDNLLYWANCQGGGSFDEDEYSITGSDLQF